MIVLAIFILVNLLRGRSILKRYGVKGGIKDMFSSFGSFSSSSMSRNGQSRPLKYYCMNCGKEHREITCPNCGSKMKRIGKGHRKTKSSNVQLIKTINTTYIDI
jgi:DNA-directed RNA polymerase subunit RPC12/RpoP